MKKDYREKRNKIILSVVIALVMILSTIGFLYNRESNDNELKYTIKNKTYTFIREDDQYVLNLNKEKIGFYYLPFEIELNMSDDIINQIKNSKIIYITFKPEAGYPEYIDVARFGLTNIFMAKNIYAINGITEENEKYALPVVTCENATAYVPVILMEETNITNIEIENNCIKLQGKRLDFIKFRDIIIYKMYGIL
jgi:hypothetical protein